MASETVDYLIIGGGPAGTKAAESIRQNDPAGRIVIVTRESYRLYDRTALPKYIRGIKSRDEVFMRSEQQYKDQKIERWDNLWVVTLDPEKRVAILSDKREISFKKALIASGGAPSPWEVAGADKPGVVRLNTFDDADYILNLLPSVDEMIIVGGGFISLEFCSIAEAHKKKATVLVREPYYWANLLDEVSGNLIVKHLKKNGISVRTGEEVAEVVGSRRVEAVKTRKGEVLSAQMVGVGIGIRRNLDFLIGTSVEVNKGVVTNEFLESSVKNIWAAGDVAEFQDVFLGIRHMLGNWANASDQGIFVGHVMTGKRESFTAVSSYSITCFDFNVAFVGNPKPEGAEVIERGDKEATFGRIFVKDDRIVGATLIARPMDRPPLKELIRHQVPVDAGLRAILSDHTKPIPMRGA